VTIKYDQLNQLVGTCLRRSKFQVFQHVEPILAEYKLATGQFSVLLIIKTFPGQTQVWIANKASLERSSLTPVFKRLEKLDYIKRSKHPENVHALAVNITEKGEQVIDEASDKLIEFETKLEALFTNEETKNLVSYLQRIEEFGKDLKTASKK